MTVLAHSLERTVFIRATRDTVFRYFTDSPRWAAWWGAGSTIDPHPGGAVVIRLPGGVEVTGEVLELVAPEHIAFSYGFASGTPIPAGGSRVTIHLQPTEDGTWLRLTHEFADATVRDSFLQAWRYQLSLFANVVSREVTAGAGDAVDAWFGAWSIADAGARHAALAGVATDGVQYRDRYSATAGIADLVPHIAAFQQHMPGLQFQRNGPVRECQNFAAVEWVAQSADGQQRGSGTAGFAFDCNGRITSVVNFWNETS
jgi:uncharacterized protein YndB with AHSA1/START domain